ncbi:hypothetical protein [Parageobacillus sp. G301]|jgi:hypothetical protein|uniref:hypothetical protein n=1 Tax=Parageobacillus sp. G301 TaxID=2998290 RepID=UPI0024978257|nr:hypothetical protein [Parageobacillus sp. G301]GLH64383.1 hypothetical protein PG301_22220 [Parageobacillus sp. G301]
MTKLKLFISILLMLTFFILPASTNPASKTTNEVSIPLSNSNPKSISIKMPGKTFEFIKSTSFTHIKAKDKNYYYKIKDKNKILANLRVTIRAIDNGDKFIFTRITNYSKQNIYTYLIIPLSNTTAYNLEKYSDRGKIIRQHDHVFGIDPTSHPIGVLNAYNKNQTVASMMLGKNYISKQLVKRYSKTRASYVREFLEETDNYKIHLNSKTKSTFINLNLKTQSNSIGESWVLISNQLLFKNKNNMDYWMKRSIEEYISTHKWLTADGPYFKLPWSIEPATKMGFGRNLGYMQGDDFVSNYSFTKERFFYNMIINSLADLDVFSHGEIRNNKVSVFQTEYTSTWLKREYGITAPYIDTRHNEFIALFLKKAGTTLNINNLKNANLIYADFLVKQAAIGNTINLKSGYLINDYFSTDGKKTHVSLNHVLGEMRFLLDAYKQTKNQKYLNVAMQIRKGVESLGTKWLRKDGDTWYQVNRDLKFFGRDYKLLTLGDLLYSQKSWEEVGYKRSPVFDILIKSKYKYLTNINYPIKPNILNELKRQGFIQ